MAAVVKMVYPAWCGNCGKQEVRPGVGPYRIEVKHDGAVHLIEIPELSAPRCAACENVIFGREEDEQINAAIRQRFGLLSPDEIRRRREDGLGMSRADLAARLGVAEDQIARWEGGALIQSTALDRLLRVFFDVPEARAYLQAAAKPAA